MDSVSPLYKSSGILKLHDSIRIKNFCYVYDGLNDILPQALSDNFTKASSLHRYQTRNSLNHCVLLPKVNTSVYGLKSIKYRSASDWNYIMNSFVDNHLNNKCKSYCKKHLTNYFLQSY